MSARAWIDVTDYLAASLLPCDADCECVLHTALAALGAPDVRLIPGGYDAQYRAWCAWRDAAARTLRGPQ